MAINHDDRISTARLAEFWTTAKAWIRSLVSDEIDASETAMNAAVDTKIAAAKPDYNMPNENDQIGVGYGWNESYVSCFKITSTITYTNIFNALVTGTSQWRYNIDYTNPDMPTSDILSAFEKNVLAGARKHVLLNLAVGKLVVLPSEMSDIAETLISNNRQITDAQRKFVKSHYNNSKELESEVMTYNEHTYQTKLNETATGNNNYNYYVKKDNGTYTNITPSSSNPVYIIAITQKPNALFNFDFGAVGKRSVGFNQLAYNVKQLFPQTENARYWGGSAQGDDQRIATFKFVSKGQLNEPGIIHGLVVQGRIDKLFDNSTYPAYAFQEDDTNGFFIPNNAISNSYPGTFGGYGSNTRYMYGTIYLDNGTTLEKYDARINRTNFNDIEGIYTKVYNNEFFNHISDTTTFMQMVIPIQSLPFMSTSW